MSGLARTVQMSQWRCSESEAEDFDTHEYQKSIREMNNVMYREIYEAYEMKYDLGKVKKTKKSKESK